jgi:hypothetical protein
MVLCSGRASLDGDLVLREGRIGQLSSCRAPWLNGQVLQEAGYGVCAACIEFV